MAITFKKDAKLCPSAGLKFFSEPKGIDLIRHVLAGTSAPITNIPPLIFERPDVYFSYYYNPEGLRMYEQNQTSNLPCVVYGIPKTWSHVCWLLDTISTEMLRIEKNKIAFIPYLSKLLKIATDLMRNIVGPCILKELANQLVIRLTLKLRKRL